MITKASFESLKVNLNLERAVGIGIIIFSIFITTKTPLYAALSVMFLLLLLSICLLDIKTFLVVLIAFKMVINAFYNVYIFENISILKIIGVFMPLFLVALMLVKKIDLKTYPFYQIILLFLGEVILGSIIDFIFSGNLRLAEVEKFLRLLNGITFYFAIPLLFKTKKDIKLLLGVWFITLGFPLIIGLYQIFTGQLHYQIQSVSGFELHRAAGIYHDVGVIGFSGIFFAILLFFFYNKPGKGIKSAIFYILLALSSFITYKTYSKGVAITLAVILIVFTIYSRKKMLLVFSSLVIFGIFFSESSGVHKRIQHDIEVREQFGDFGKTLMFAGRMGIWERNLNKYIGYNTLQKLFGRETGGAHNDFIRVLLDNGFLGLVLYTAIIALILIRLFASFRSEEDMFYRNLIFIAFLSQISYIMTCFGTTPSLYTDYQWFHWGLVGIAFMRVRRRIKHRESVPRNE